MHDRMYEKVWRRCFAVFVIVNVVCSVNVVFPSDWDSVRSENGGRSFTPAFYTREYLLSLKDSPLSSEPPSIDIDFAERVQPVRKKQKKRGSRGGVRNRLRRKGSRLPLPTVTLTNARALVNKMDELTALVRHDGDYRRSNLLCVTETWLDDIKDIGDLESWATNYTVRETISTKDFEILTVSFRPHYLPREFSQVTVILAYVPGPNKALAADQIAECYNRALSRASDQPVFLLGDFSTCDVSRHLPHLHQYVTHPTRKSKILDKCYLNIRDAYVDRVAPPLARSDHNVVHLLPPYRQVVKRVPPQTRRVKQWSGPMTVQRP
jgi:hypothetical protein